MTGMDKHYIGPVGRPTGSLMMMMTLASYQKNCPPCGSVRARTPPRGSDKVRTPPRESVRVRTPPRGRQGRWRAGQHGWLTLLARWQGWCSVNPHPKMTISFHKEVTDFRGKMKT